MEKLSAHLAHSEELHKAQVKELTTHLAHTNAGKKLTPTSQSDTRCK